MSQWGSNTGREQNHHTFEGCRETRTLQVWAERKEPVTKTSWKGAAGGRWGKPLWVMPQNRAKREGKWAPEAEAVDSAHSAEYQRKLNDDGNQKASLRLGSYGVISINWLDWTQSVKNLLQSIFKITIISQIETFLRQKKIICKKTTNF